MHFSSFGLQYNSNILYFLQFEFKGESKMNYVNCNKEDLEKEYAALVAEYMVKVGFKT